MEKKLQLPTIVICPDCGQHAFILYIHNSKGANSPEFNSKKEGKDVIIWLKEENFINLTDEHQLYDELANTNLPEEGDWNFIIRDDENISENTNIKGSQNNGFPGIFLN